MKQPKLLGKLIPGHPDVSPIIESIRAKYQIPEIRPHEEDFNKILLSNIEIDWKLVREDIEQQIRENDTLLPPDTKMFYKGAQAINATTDYPELAPLDEKTRNSILLLLKFAYSIFTPIVPAVDEMYKALADLVFENILTGKTREAPQDWFAKVFVMPSFGEKVVVAMAGELSDPKVVAEQFKAEFTKTFGKDRPQLTELNLKTAEYLAMRLQGKSLNDMVELYIDKYPDQFPKNRDSTAYRNAVKKHKATLKKNIQRLQNTLDSMLGDKN